MSKRPKIDLKLNNTDKFLEIISWLMLIGIWLFTLSNYSVLPEKIPTHYNFLGEADTFGNKKTIFFLPILCSVLFIVLTFLRKHPHTYNNYPIEITNKNAEYHYKNAIRMMLYLKITIAIIFGIIIYKTIKPQSINNLGIWFLPFSISIVFIPIIYFYINANKDTNR